MNLMIYCELYRRFLEELEINWVFIYVLDLQFCTWDALAPGFIWDQREENRQSNVTQVYLLVTTGTCKQPVFFYKTMVTYNYCHAILLPRNP